MSPTISMVPFMLPMKLTGVTLTGTSFATGFPRLVMVISMRCRWTSSSNPKHFALNSPAAIFSFMTIVILA